MVVDELGRGEGVRGEADHVAGEDEEGESEAREKVLQDGRVLDI